MHYLVTIIQWKEIPFSLFYGSAIQDLEGLTSLPVSDETGCNFRFLLLQVLHYCWAHGWVAIYTYSLSSLARTPHWLFPPHILLCLPLLGPASTHHPTVPGLENSLSHQAMWGSCRGAMAAPEYSALATCKTQASAPVTALYCWRTPKGKNTWAFSGSI